MENVKEQKPKKSLTIFLICCTMLLSLACLGAGVYSLYISIGFRFLRRSAVGGLNTSALYTYSNSGYTTGGGTMIGLILVSLVMLGLGIGMTIIFFKQLPLYKQIKLVAKLPTIKYKDYSKKVRKSVIVYSIISYIVCIGFSIFAIVVAFKSEISPNYLWIVVSAFAAVLALSISSMVLMFLKLGQLSKIKKKLKSNEAGDNSEGESADNDNLKPSSKHKKSKNNNITSSENVQEPQKNIDINTEIVKTDEPKKLFTDGIFELNSQLQKLREMHLSGLIDSNEYTLIREKWINAVLSEPLFGKKQKVKIKSSPKSNLIISKNAIKDETFKPNSESKLIGSDN